MRSLLIGEDEFFLRSPQTARAGIPVNARGGQADVAWPEPQAQQLRDVRT